MSGCESAGSSNVRALLAAIRAEGSMPELMYMLQQELQSDAGFELIEGGMSDAAKRRPSDDELDDHRCAQKQRPVSPERDGKDVNKELFPPGITSVSQWGRTILSAGKFAKDGLTYLEVCQDPDNAKYCTWLEAQKDRKELNPVLKDFGMFLEMKRKQAYKASAPSTMCYPGSTIPRQLK